MLQWNRYTLFIFAFVLSLSFFFSFPSQAGNPLYMNADGKPLVWDTTQTIPYKVDPKGLGKLSFEESLTLIQQAMLVWESVDETGIQFEYLGPLDTAITPSNWEKLTGNYIYGRAYGVTHSNTSSSQKEGYLVIGFDNTGEIMKAKGSDGASGIQSHTGVKGTYENPEYLSSAHVFINGLYINGNDSDIRDISLTDMMAIIVHELGHVLGLDHTLFHYQLYKDILSNQRDLEDTRFLPTMFPRFIKTTGPHVINLHPDDIATLKWMYHPDETPTLSGEILDATGSPVETLVVTARLTTSPLCQAFSQATGITCSDMNSVSSGQGNSYFNGKYCMDDSYLGAYVLPILENGDYSIDVQEIPFDFVDSISKFDAKTESISGGAELLTKNDVADEDAYEYDVISYHGTSKDNLDIILASEDSHQEDLDRIDYSFFEEEDAFANLYTEDELCPLENSFDVEAAIHFQSNSSLSSNSSVEIVTSSSSTGCSLDHEEKSPLHSHPSPLIYLVSIIIFFIRQKNESRIR